MFRGFHIFIDNILHENIAVDLDDHHTKCGVLKQFSLAWETAVDEWANEDDQCANLINSEKNKFFSARLFKWRNPVFPFMLHNNMDETPP